MSDNDDTPNEPTPEQLQEKFNGMFETAMDAWVAKKKAEEENAPKRTQKPRGFMDTLFGG